MVEGRRQKGVGDKTLPLRGIGRSIPVDNLLSFTIYRLPQKLFQWAIKREIFVDSAVKLTKGNFGEVKDEK